MKTTYKYFAIIGTVAIIAAVVIVCLVMSGCDWGDQTIEEWNPKGQRIYRRRTSIGSFLKESLIENGRLFSDPNRFEITVDHAELKTSEVKAVTPYGTIGVNND